MITIVSDSCNAKRTTWTLNEKDTRRNTELCHPPLLVRIRTKVTFNSLRNLFARTASSAFTAFLDLRARNIVWNREAVYVHVHVFLTVLLVMRFVCKQETTPKCRIPSLYLTVCLTWCFWGRRRTSGECARSRRSWYRCVARSRSAPWAECRTRLLPCAPSSWCCNQKQTFPCWITQAAVSTLI